MPKRKDLSSILVIGSGPIVIGQACEFDYSGTQALRALKEEGFRVILVNSNPATIMTDPDLADATYIEPLTVDSVSAIIEKERPSAILPTMGGQTALNLALNLAQAGVLEAFGVTLIGAKLESIEKAENRERFKQAMQKIGVPVPQSMYVRRLEEASAALDLVGLPCMIRASFTLGGSGASVAYNHEEYERMVRSGLEASPVGEVLVEASILGWKEYELEMMRDVRDNVIVVCSMENIDAVGVHTGDSMAVAPAQTLSDRMYQTLRDYAIAIMREIGVDSGGSNIQFAVHPHTDDVRVIEMNPRVSRSSALASKATGYPIARIAAKLAVGYTLDEIPNAITGNTKASFEPTLDYVVTKLPRFDFAKFPGADRALGPQMKAVGEVMALGQTFCESFQKALRSLEMGLSGFEAYAGPDAPTLDELMAMIRTPRPERIQWIAQALSLGATVAQVSEASLIDPWFVSQWKHILEAQVALHGCTRESLSADDLRSYKRQGFSDAQLGRALGLTEVEMYQWRKSLGVLPVYKAVDTCAAEFEASTNYVYSTYGDEDEVQALEGKTVMILGSGPNRIGQGVEFDYCCVRASMALRKLGYQSIMVNCNPETVSTDFDISSRLYFEPLTLEHILPIVEKERVQGVILQLGGQTPLKLAKDLERLGVPILGTTVDTIDVAEDRDRFKHFAQEVGLRLPESRIAHSAQEALSSAEDMGYPIVMRPSYVLGGRAMEIIWNEMEAQQYVAHYGAKRWEHPLLLDRYLENSIEIDVDVVGSGDQAVVAGVMQHIEEAGVHSGDSSCVLPPYSLSPAVKEEIQSKSVAIARGLGVKGLLNIQFALQGEALYVLEVNPRASRTVPFVCKALGLPLVDEAVKAMLGVPFELRVPHVQHYSVKSPVFPFLKFRQADTLLGPEMKSTGEVMGVDLSWELAYAKAQFAASNPLPLSGTVFMSVNDSDKEALMPIAQKMRSLGFRIISTRGTADYLLKHGIPAEKVNKVHEGRPHIVDAIVNGKVDLVFNTTRGKASVKDSFSIRRSALERAVPYFTTLSGARAASEGIAHIRKETFKPWALQALHRRLRG